MVRHYILQKLKQLDQFGAVYKPSINYDTQEYKTILGGFTSIVLYGISFAYFFYYIVLWETNQLLPKITNTEMLENHLTYEVQDMIASFYMRKTTRGSGIDPFDTNSLILQPILHVFKNSTRISSIPLMYQSKSQRYNNSQVNLEKLKFVLSSVTNNEDVMTDYMLTFGICQDTHLIAGWKCANNQEIEKFFEQPVNAITVNSYVKQFNTQAQQIQEIAKEYYTLFDNTSTYYSQNTLKLKTISVDNGILLQSQTDYQYITNVETVTQQLNINYFKNIFNQTIYMAFAFKLGAIRDDTWVEYPKISEVLAEIGSIVSIILVFSYLVILRNEQKLYNEAITCVIQMYYPEIKNVVFIKNWWGQVQEIYLKNKLLNKEKFMNYYAELQDTARQKLCISNQIYEISRYSYRIFRLQFIIQSNEKRENFQLSHSIGIKLKELQIDELKVDQSASSQNLNDHAENTNLQNVSLKIPQSQINSDRELQVIPISQTQPNNKSINNNNNNNNNDNNNNIIQQNYFLSSEDSEFILNDEDFKLLSQKDSNSFEQQILIHDKVKSFYSANIIK